MCRCIVLRRDCHRVICTTDASARKLSITKHHFRATSRHHGPFGRRAIFQRFAMSLNNSFELGGRDCIQPPSSRLIASHWGWRLGALFGLCNPGSFLL